MAIKSKTSVKSFFEAGDVPTSGQFVDLIDSTYNSEIEQVIALAASAGSTGLVQIDSASAVSFLVPATAGRAIVTASTPASVRTILEAGSAGQDVWLAGTQASARTAIDVTAASVTKAGLIEIATTAEVTTGTDTAKVVTPAGLAATTFGIAVQVVNTVVSAVSTGSTTIPLDDTIPQNTEGDEYMSLAITPTDAANLLKIEVTINITNSGGASVNAQSAALFQDTTANALAAVTEEIQLAGRLTPITFVYWMTAGSASETTFKVRAGHNAGTTTTTFNGNGGTRLFGGVMASSITITEYKA